MKKSYLFLICLFVSLQFVDAAHYFNKERRVSGYHTQSHFSLVYIKADRSMGTIDNEDRFEIHYMFTSNVNNVEIVYEAMDGTNDLDTRKYTKRYSSIASNKLQTVTLGNLPTYVDNFIIKVVYYVGETYHEETIYVYSLGEPDKGSGTFAASEDGVPQQYIDSDGNGAWDSNSGIGKIGSPLLKMVAAPYNLIKWLTDKNTIISLMISGVIVWISVMLFIRLPSGIAYIMILPLLIGLNMFLGTVFEALDVI